MINIDPFFLLALDYIHVNPITFGALWCLLKLLAKRSANTTDDKILTMIGGWLGVKF